MKLNIGCGHKVLEGYINIDEGNYGQEVVQDALTYIAQQPTESVDEVLMHHFIEHFEVDQVKVYLNSLHRIMKKDGEVYIVVPHKDRDRAWILTHKSFYTEATFDNLTDIEQCKDYGFKPWTIKKMVTNNRKDIHVWLKKSSALLIN